MSTSDRLHAGEHGRLLLRGQELHAGDPLELQVRGAYVPARVEWSPDRGWYALYREAGRSHRELTALLGPGTVARPLSDRSDER